MPVISKELFYKSVPPDTHCKEVHVWNDDCRKICFSPFFILSVIKGTGKFFLPIYLLKLILNYKRIRDVDFIKSLIVAEATSIAYGLVMATLFMSSICLLRKIFGRIHYYNLVLLPAMVSGLSLLVESKENQVLDTLIFFNSFVETVLKKINFYFIKSTTIRETLLFMGVSASLMYLLENREQKLDILYFWFYTPPRKESETNSEGTICSHESNCWKYWNEGFLKYFSLGYLVNVVRTFLPKAAILTKRPQKIVNVLFSKSNAQFGLFIGAYVATYRVLTCYLKQWRKIKPKFHGLTAGFFSGLTYAISPNVQVLVIGITTILQILYAYISERLNIGSNFWPRQILYMLCHGFLFHVKLFDSKCCSPYYKSMIDACTNNLVPTVFKILTSKYFSNTCEVKDFTKYLPGT